LKHENTFRYLGTMLGITERVSTAGADFGTRLHIVARDNPLVTQLRGRSLLWGLAFTANRTDFALLPRQFLSQKTWLHMPAISRFVVYPVSGFARAHGADAIGLAPLPNISTRHPSQATSLKAQTLALAVGELAVY